MGRQGGRVGQRDVVIVILVIRVHSGPPDKRREVTNTRVIIRVIELRGNHMGSSGKDAAAVNGLVGSVSMVKLVIVRGP